MSSYGCFNRGEYKDQKLYGINSLTGFFISIEIPHVLTRDCQYSKFDRYADPKCVGCNRKQESVYVKGK